ncbi:hypothetical protein GCM10023205_52880 [Yinghuangia aomiensis]|uniref:Uncharacterized protein n=2 Tax=Yinghuangia aomiensis TaxID=676205 RepID=A0ABP9HU39_9ACTN
MIPARSASPLMPLRIFHNANRSGCFGIMFVTGIWLAVLFYFSPCSSRSCCASVRSSPASPARRSPSARRDSLRSTVGTLLSADDMFRLSAIDADSGYAGSFAI